MREAMLGAAELAKRRVGDTSGALVFACSARLAALGERFGEEQQAIARVIGAPTAGACVFGEIGRANREVQAFHNTTTVVVAWPT